MLYITTINIRIHIIFFSITQLPNPPNNITQYNITQIINVPVLEVVTRRKIKADGINFVYKGIYAKKKNI